ncbi:Ferric siderophore transport system, periplasmic binding protein TonB [Flavobacterium sp. 9R]|uniref:energy transducer TonB n=1 Tax=Flavobacterium sp. 9R TaxID=2653143 RepID=UPI0012F2C9CE|nr:energy transducer TonB [Flavobacterium sp. 9R]VXB01712.1 Ferric siderophore transport system, periplasmic binding protein TonB [Flavobacterium sp. 9R]
MKYLETKEEKKAFTFTSILFVMLFFMFFFLGLTSLDPPPENGITINFGTSETGNGDVQPIKPIATSPQPVASTSKQSSAEEELITQETEEAIVLNENKKKTTEKENSKDTPKTKPIESPKPSKSTTDALSSLINGPKNPGKASEGEGNDLKGGDKGHINGNPYANSYYGSGNGNGGNGNSWGLNGRKISTRGKEIPKCNETGTVVIQITVNQNGNVIAAKPTKGTTNTNPCLIEPAIMTAKKHKWLADANAPEAQIGFITIHFKLGE